MMEDIYVRPKASE